MAKLYYVHDRAARGGVYFPGSKEELERHMAPLIKNWAKETGEAEAELWQTFWSNDCEEVPTIVMSDFHNKKHRLTMKSAELAHKYGPQALKSWPAICRKLCGRKHCACDVRLTTKNL
jgi:hypothetical protein